MQAKRWLAVAATWLLWLPAFGQVQQSFNVGRHLADARFSPTEVAWTYVPGAAFDLTAVLTQFGSVDGRSVDLEIYDGYPIPSAQRLLTASFEPSATGLSGAHFPALHLEAGHNYLIGFRHVDGLGVNFTDEASADFVSVMRYGFDGDYRFGSAPFFASARPVLVLMSAVPEPAAPLLGLLGAGCLALVRRRSRAP